MSQTKDKLLIRKGELEIEIEGDKDFILAHFREIKDDIFPTDTNKNVDNKDRSAQTTEPVVRKDNNAEEVDEENKVIKTIDISSEIEIEDANKDETKDVLQEESSQEESKKESVPVKTLDEMTLLEFYKYKKPKNHNESIITFAYWLLEREARKDFRPKDIIAKYRELELVKPTNITQNIKYLRKKTKAYLTNSTKDGYYKITKKGVEFVDTQLPDKGGK